MAQKDQDAIIKRAPYVDVVFGTHNIGSLPILLERARVEEASQVEIKESLEHFPSTLPVKRDSAFSAWVSVSVGCNNTCTFCIVPQLRGIEKDRPASEIMSEVRALVDQGVIEITLLGQNVNAYGVDFGDRTAFAKLLKECAKVDGLERVRFMSPHPRDFTDDVIEAMAESKNVMPHLHMPLQSGSDKVLQAMRRSYRADRYLGILEKVRRAMPDAAITTDIIVGFPGESDADFDDTIKLVKQARFSAAYTFQYSKRPGTPAAAMADQIADDVMAGRYNQLHKIQQEISKSENEKLIGKTVELLVSGHEGRHDLDQNRMNGRSADFRLTHFDNTAKSARPGDLVEVKVVEAFANHIVAGAPINVKKTKGGDAHATWVEDNQDRKILLGIPTLASLKSL
jgi:tRNA-2-methylthio-N6-dimethylallyladenosine synthase